MGQLRWTTALGMGAAAAITFSAGDAGVAVQSGTIERKSPLMDAVAPPSVRIEKLADGFKFVEGPVWNTQGVLLFSDIPNDAVMKWDPKTGAVTRYRARSAATNGNTLDRQGRLVSCEHSGRRVSVEAAPGRFETLTDRFDGKRFNSPNDVIFKSDGALYFTDPPYGLPKQDDDPSKELAFNGVYRLKDGKVTLLTKELTRPNGLAFSPDDKTLYVANSDAARKLWMAYPVRSDGSLGAGRIFHDVTSSKEDGLPDGMKVDTRGNVYGTGPGGVWVFSPDGAHLGTIKPPEPPANCHWGDDGKTLYMTARTSLYRVRLSISGIRP